VVILALCWWSVESDTAVHTLVSKAQRGAALAARIPAVGRHCCQHCGAGPFVCPADIGMAGQTSAWRVFAFDPDGENLPPQFWMPRGFPSPQWFGSPSWASLGILSTV